MESIVTVVEEKEEALEIEDLFQTEENDHHLIYHHPLDRRHL